MIRHMVLWMLKPEAKITEEIKNQNIERQIIRSHEMFEHASMMKDLRVYKGVRAGSDVYDFVVVMDFDSLDDLEKFEKSPDHMDPVARSFGLSIRERKAVIDIELD